MLHHSQGALLVALHVVVELHNHQPLSRVGVAYDDVAQQSVLFPEVEERYAVLEGIVAYGIAYAVVHVVHQPAFLDGQNLVERPRDMESYAVHVVILESRCHLLSCEPSLVAASELQFVAVGRGLLRAEYRRNLRQLNLADSP